MRRLLLTAVLCLAGRAAAAQDAYLPLPPGHWALDAVRRAEALGLVTHYLPAQRTASREEVGAALGEALENARGRPGLEGLARGWALRYREEFTGGIVLQASRVGVAWIEADGLAAPGAGYRADFGRPPTGAAPIPDRATPAAFAEIALAEGWLGAYAAGAADEDDARLERGELTIAGRGVALSIGRGATGYGYAAAGGITLTGAALDRVQVQTLRPVRLPAGLGRMALHGQAGLPGGDRHPGDPALISVAITLKPHRRLTLAGYRAAILGGDSAGAPLTGRTFLQSLLGLTQNRENGFSNQVASLDVRWRAPTEAWVPVTLYLEGGMEDLSVIRSLRRSPGVLAGAFLPMLPGLPEVGLGVERTSFGRSCCGNGIWYRHFQHHGGWAAGDAPLGHPLGGHGHETAAYLQLDDPSARLRVNARGFRRFRGAENLYAPGREGRSHGVVGRVRWRAAPPVELELDGGYEQGEGWRARSLAIGAAWLF